MQSDILIIFLHSVGYYILILNYGGTVALWKQQAICCQIIIVLYGWSESVLKLLQDDKVRKRNDWKKWIPASALLPSDSGFVSPNNSSHDRLVTSFQKITVQEVNTNQSGVIGKADPISEPVTGRCLTESTGEAQIPNGEVTQNTYTERN